MTPKITPSNQYMPYLLMRCELRDSLFYKMTPDSG